MDESLLELENELKRLSPRRPSRAMLAVIERDLADPVPAARYSTATTLRSWKWGTWSLAGAATIVALVLSIQTMRRPAVGGVPGAGEPFAQADGRHPVSANPGSEAEPADRYEPIQATSVLYALQEEASATLPDHTAGRAVRYRFVDTYTWKNRATNASMRWSVPRDEVRLVRANLD